MHVVNYLQPLISSPPSSSPSMIRNYAPESTSTYPPAASRPCSNAPSTTPTHQPSLTERITDQVGRWYGRWVGGSVELSVIPY